jgi:hypothetical protein
VFLKPDIAIRRARKIFQDLVREEQQTQLIEAAE